MNTLGCSFAILTMAALAVSLVPILSWTVYAVALPMSAFGMIHATRAARQSHAQQADTAMMWVSAGLLVLTLLRLAAF